MGDTDHGTTTCLRCSGEMAEGYLLDEGGLSGRHQSCWVAGPVREGAFGSAKPGDSAKYKVIAMRCEDCGWLDQYARKRAY